MQKIIDENKIDLVYLKKKARWVRIETLKIHALFPGTRIASSLSPVEIFVALYYGGILDFDPTNPLSPDRDRIIISKAHGAVSLYPILAELGFFAAEELKNIGKDGSFLGAIPDPNIPGFETMNGSLGHGLGVACGIALALERKSQQESVFVLSGDGELYEGSVFEALMFAGEHCLQNLNLIIDNNKISMLEYCKDIIDLKPLEEKFKVFGWDVIRIDGHNLLELHNVLMSAKKEKNGRPKVIIADTIKGKGVKALEYDPMSHVKTLSPEEIKKAIEDLEQN